MSDPAQPATDPAGFDAIESLYRQTDGVSRRPSGVRPFEPALRPPENTDGYGWLYRPAEPDPVTDGPLAASPTLTTTSGLAVLDPAAAGEPSPAWSPATISGRRWPSLLLLAAALSCAALLALLVPLVG